MKTRLIYALFLLVPGIAFTQKVYTVINGYTLNNMEGYEINPSSKQITIEYVYDDGFTVKMMTKRDSIRIAMNGFKPETITFGDYSGKESPHYIVMEPDDSLSALYLRNDRVAPGDSINTEKIYSDTEVSPEFPGGRTALMKYLAEHLRYPEQEMEIGITGKVYTQFVVEKDGSIAYVDIARGRTHAMNQECIRVILQMPKWNPAKVNGTPVRCLLNLPISFSLQ